MDGRRTLIVAVVTAGAGVMASLLLNAAPSQAGTSAAVPAGLALAAAATALGPDCPEAVPVCVKNELLCVKIVTDPPGVGGNCPLEVNIQNHGIVGAAVLEANLLTIQRTTVGYGVVQVMIPADGSVVLALPCVGTPDGFPITSNIYIQNGFKAPVGPGEFSQIEFSHGGPVYRFRTVGNTPTNVTYSAAGFTNHTTLVQDGTVLVNTGNTDAIVQLTVGCHFEPERPMFPPDPCPDP